MEFILTIDSADFCFDGCWRRKGLVGNVCDASFLFMMIIMWLCSFSLLRYASKPAAKIRLFFFPYAGGAPNTFSKWGANLPDWVEVSTIYLPARLTRRKQPPINDWRVLSKAIGDAIIQDMKGSHQLYATYGHSFGGLLSFLTVVHIREQDGPMPVTFMVGAKKPPILFLDPPPKPKKENPRIFP